MSDTHTVSPPAPAATPAATPAPTHHSALQPREQGKFAGAPDPAKAGAAAVSATPPPAATPEAPKTWKVGGKEFKSADDLYAYAAEKDAEARALDEFRRRESEAARKAKEYEEKIKDPRKALTPELEQEILARHVREWQEAEAFKAMSPAEQQLYLMRKQLEKERATLESEKAERKRQEDEAKAAADREREEKETAAQRAELSALITGALDVAGLERTTANIQAVVMVLRGAGERGVVYPPEVVAKKARERIHGEHHNYIRGQDPVALLTAIPELIERLNGLSDAPLLRKLAPLGETLRRLNLESLGATPAAAPTPVSTGATASGAPVDLPPGHPDWAKVFKDRARR